ncbi:hypothetical protein HZ993_12350 [Rhodoferax sp. AJA081-3]|uniref:hypothetical protein n=1 Tax=Rhodoferax sp. AJA081-3 TaxID=2752316 RepID=UPI001ADFC5B1|nr:hypothetical protein [Rhodoferax sp. AJA081-3]QTN26142.1 hypothetical protein HZ993_12350 [Rhodoferax sp. AJA081-3]
MKITLLFLNQLLVSGLLFLATPASAARCSNEIARGIDDSETDYYDAKRAACLVKESKALKASVFGVTSHRPDRAWKLTHALLCGKGADAEATIRPRILNPIKHLVVGYDQEKDTVTREYRTARDLMTRGCAFTPDAEALSGSVLKISYIPYSPHAYCGAAFILEFRKGDWLITETQGACD